MAIEFYKEFGELGYLANYSNHGFYKNGIFYKTVEHYYQSEKYDNPDIRKKIIEAQTPKEASNIGRDRNNIRKDNFKKIKLQVMYDGVLEKFRQNREIAYKLIETRNEDIQEATVDEYYWGIGKDKTGENHIGEILVRVRERIKREILDEIIKKCRQSEVVYVIGHRNPDADSCFSSYLLSRILKGIGVNAQFAVLSENYDYCSTDRKLIERFLPEEPITVDDINDKKFVLVDHNNLEGLDKENVLGAIDHHIITGEVYDTLEMEYSSTGLLIYDLFKDIYEFIEEERMLIFLSVLADTEYLCSRYNEADRELVLSLNMSLDVESLKREYFAINNFDLSIEENLHSNYKEYRLNDRIIKRSLIYGYSKEYELYFEKYVQYIKDNHEDMLLIWCDFESKKTYVYYKGNYFQYDYVLTSTNLILKKIK